MINWIKGHKDSTIKVPLNETILNELTLNNRNISNLTWGDTNDVRDIDIIKVVINNLEIYLKRLYG